MGCGASQTTAIDANQMENGSSIDGKTDGIRAPIAFEVPGADDVNDLNNGKISIIKSHPPKRLRRLEDEQTELSQAELERRQVEAENRRKAILQMRVQSARVSTSKGLKRRQSPPINEEEEVIDLD